MEYQVTHTTEYNYNQSVSLCHNVARLLLRNTHEQLCKKTQVKITPQPDVLEEYEDFFGNKVLYFAIQQEHAQLKVTVITHVEKKVEPNNGLNFYLETPWEEIKQQLNSYEEEHIDAVQYLYETDFTKANKEIKEYAAASFTQGRSFFEAAKELTARIFTDFEFSSGFTTVATPLTAVMKARKGVCQDFAHLAIACIRSMGLPAKYVSGYIETIPPKGQEKLFGVDASHAWFSIYIPMAGWIDFDPTNNIIPSTQHITIGWGRDYADITPLKGVITSSGTHQLAVSVDVRRIN
jgi:transglutaminase-like putative cysteine protease